MLKSQNYLNCKDMEVIGMKGLGRSIRPWAAPEDVK